MSSRLHAMLYVCMVSNDLNAEIINCPQRERST